MKVIFYIILLSIILGCSNEIHKKNESELACNICLNNYHINNIQVKKTQDISYNDEYLSLLKNRDSLSLLYNKGIDSAMLKCEQTFNIQELYVNESNKIYFAQIMLVNELITNWEDVYYYDKVEDELKDTQQKGNYYLAKFKGQLFFLEKFEYLYLLQAGHEQHLLRRILFDNLQKELIAKIQKKDKPLINDLDLIIYRQFVNKKNNIEDLRKFCTENKEIKVILSQRLNRKTEVDIYNIISEEENKRRQLEIKKENEFKNIP